MIPLLSGKSLVKVYKNSRRIFLLSGSIFAPILQLRSQRSPFFNFTGPIWSPLHQKGHKITIWRKNISRPRLKKVLRQHRSLWARLVRPKGLGSCVWNCPNYPTIAHIWTVNTYLGIVSRIFIMGGTGCFILLATPLLKGLLLKNSFLVAYRPCSDEFHNTLVASERPPLTCYRHKDAYNIGPPGSRSLPPTDLKTCQVVTSKVSPKDLETCRLVC